ncbi:MAG: DNA primase [Succinivibrionaceae bacterium]|nr:DNA primase [Succinivibrionaceae bacterium]
MIPSEFITEIITSTNIVDVMRERHIELKPSGRGQYKARCPFHSEKTPSFYVSEDKQVYNCFGCKAKGNVIKFLTEYDKLSFVDAVETLAERLGLEVPHTAQGSRNNGKSSLQTRNLYDIMSRCADRYHEVLRSPRGSAALEYLKNRGITDDTIERFRIGYAPDLWNFISASGNGQMPENASELQELGMVKPTADGRLYDMFRHRVMIPILDRRGRVMAFGGRVLNDEQPKYLNSPEMTIFHKGRELFGLHQALEWHRNNRQELKRLVIVEGYMDVIALTQYGINYAVASLGTATTVDQLQLIFRNAPQLVCCYDGDSAGHKAAWHALVTMLPILEDSADVRFAFLPSEHDPDSFVRENGPDSFERFLNEALPLDKYLFRQLVASQTNPDNSAELADSAVNLLATMPDTFRRVQLTEILSKKVFMDVDRLTASIRQKAAYARNRNGEQQPAQQTENLLELTPIRRLLILAIQYPMTVRANAQAIVGLLNQIIDLNVNIKGLDVLAGLIKFILGQKCNVSAASIVQAYSGSELSKWIGMLAEYEIYMNASNVDPVNVGKDMLATMTRLLVEYHQNEATKLRMLSQDRSLTEDELRKLTEHLRFVKTYYRMPLQEPQKPADAK